MAKATISELKNNLSAFLKKVRAGETVVVLDRDRPIARIERIEAASQPDAVRLARLEKGGIIRRPRRKLDVDAFLADRPRSDAEPTVLSALLEDRREGR